MKRFAFASLAGALLVGTCFAQGRIVINEFQYDDSGTDDKEFVELYNAGDQPVDISGWVLAAGDLATLTDNNADYTIPGGTTLQPGQYYVLGSAVVPNVNQIVGVNNIWENDNEWLALKDTAGNIIDALAYETNKGSNFPAGHFEGLGLWGNFTSIDGDAAGTDLTFQSMSRWEDGYDTNNNGRDFALKIWTPGSNNNPTAAPSLPRSYDFDDNFMGAMVPDFTGAFRNPRYIDPTAMDDFVLYNPNIIPASPQGGNAMCMWDWAGGGNAAATDFHFTGALGAEMWVYLDTALHAGTDLESWAVGILGTTETFYNLPFINPTSACAITGLAWVWNKSSTENALRLVDAKNGGNSGNVGTVWSVLGTIDLTSMASGWYRLRIEAQGSVVRGIFGGTYGSTADGTPICGIVDDVSNRHGQFYLGFRELVGSNLATNPPRIDRLTLYAPAAGTGDVNGDGCIDDTDLAIVLAAFGSNDCTADVNNDGIVDDTDLAIVLGSFGAGC